jgi:hypothetical protein
MASTDSGGALRAVDLDNIDRDLISHMNLGRVTAIAVHSGSNGAVYIGAGSIGGTLRKLNPLTLTHEAVRGNMGYISEILPMHSASGNVLAVGTDTSGGSVSFVDMDTLDDLVTRQQNLGYIYALSSADMDQDGHAELVIASDADGGSIQLREGPSFDTRLAARTGLGEIYSLDYGSLGDEAFAWILSTSASKGGSLNVMALNFKTSHVTIQEWAGRRNLGPIRYAELHDFYLVGRPLAGVVWEDEAGPAFHVLDENLTGSETTPVATGSLFSAGRSQEPFPFHIDIQYEFER